MKNCSLDLCLSPMTSSLQSCRRDFTGYRVNHSPAISSKKINACYYGKLQECDLVEIQIRAIIEMASKERDITSIDLTPVRLEWPLGFSVKRSVERFLEKRKRKSKCVTPYTSTSSSSSHNF